jgi:protein ImuB
MTRVASVFLPNWSIDRFRRAAGDAAPPPEVPLVLIARDASKRLVQAANAGARAAGLRAGMPATKAQALVPGLVLEEADCAADTQELERLAIWLHQRVAPIVAPDPPHGIVIDTTGADHLHGGEANMLEAIVGRLALSGIEARAAIADTWSAAHALARFVSRPTVVVPRGHGVAPIASLPLECLRMPGQIAADLRVLGFETAGDLMAQPRSPLILRFGPDIGRRLAQALGELGEPIVAVKPADLVEARRAFAEPIGAPETITPQHRKARRTALRSPRATWPRRAPA